MYTRRTRRREPPSIGRTLRYYALAAVYTIVAVVVMYFVAMWSMGQVVNIAANMMKATPVPR